MKSRLLQQMFPAGMPALFINMVLGRWIRLLQKPNPIWHHLPIPYDPNLKCYKDMPEEMKAIGHNNPNLPKAQALKDATMAAFIAKYAGNGKLFIHYEGSYHSDHFQGILWYLNKYKPGLKIITISTVEQKDIDTFAKKSVNLANFIVVVPEDMTKTH